MKTGRLLGVFENQGRKQRTYVCVLTVTALSEDWEDSVQKGRDSGGKQRVQANSPVSYTCFCRIPANTKARLSPTRCKRQSLPSRIIMPCLCAICCEMELGRPLPPCAVSWWGGRTASSLANLCIMLLNHLDLLRSDFKQFSCFSDAFKSSLKNPCKILNKPKPCGNILDVFNAPHIILIVIFFTAVIFVHLT